MCALIGQSEVMFILIGWPEVMSVLIGQSEVTCDLIGHQAVLAALARLQVCAGAIVPALLQAQGMVGHSPLCPQHRHVTAPLTVLLRRVVMGFRAQEKQKQPRASGKTTEKGKMAWKILGLDIWAPKILWEDTALLRREMWRGDCCLWYFKKAVQLNIQQRGSWAWIRVKIVKAVTLVAEETTHQDSSRNWMRL